jgi:hypothetical protein
MTKLDVVKLVINVAAGIGVSKVTNDVITNNVNVDSTGDQIKVAIGSVVIGSMIGEMASDHVNRRIDKIASIWQNRKTVKPSAEFAGSVNDQPV